MGSKQWWTITKDLQGLSREDLIPPLARDDGTIATSSQERAETLAQLFSTKMSVEGTSDKQEDF